MTFKLSAELHGHMSDVRGLVAQGDDILVSVSRDKTGRIWKRAGPNSFSEDSVLLGHTGYVNSVAAIAPTAEYPLGLIATGGADKTICLWDPSSLGQPSSTLAGHTDNVCALASSSDGRVLVSGSWDKTAKVWVDGTCKHTLRGHQQAVWSVLVLSDGSVLTGSADRSIRRWVGGELKGVYEGHTDCVRALAPLPGGFVSAGNDGSVRVWALESTSCQAELYGHTSFVYTLAVLPDGAIVSGAEDRSVRVWRNGELAQIILLPSTSVWAVAALGSDIACGSSDGVVRVFSAQKQRLAEAGILAAHEQANASFAVSRKTMGDIDTAKLPGPERLAQPGAKDQQVIMVKSGQAVEAHQWDQATQQWSKVGEVVDAVGQAQKQVFDGREYDYVFDVDIQEGMPPLKLPYNAAENPYAAAQKFLERNGINLDHLDTVANFIIKNTDGVQLGTGVEASADPFTGGSRYVPGQGAASGASALDPFTSGRYVPAGSATYEPPAEYIVNAAGNAAGIVRKLAEFNAALPADLSIGAAQLQALQGLDPAQPLTLADDVYAALLKSAMTWPADKRFPSLDLLRLAVAVAPPAEGPRGFVESIGDATGLFALPAAGTLGKGDEVNLMMGARALANAFATPQGADLVWQARTQVLKALDGSWIKATNPNLITALASLYLNLAIAASKRGDDDEGLNILSAASRFLACTTSADAQLRLASVFGVLAHKFQLCKDSARVLGDETIVILGFQGASDAVKRAAKDLGAFLSS
ncbi:hypothetical protein H4S07_002989 [Coemansia furcata]|uniref:Uncharacterized protein n=1 Tax=Coemansia furcata TaxID=417177 RepID=A0ACC1LJ35_9FUNG|nr:hypothetical protein H4S07_002989 [Coemansia furcata]